MAQGRLDEAAEVMSGELIGGAPGARWSGASIDSRLVAGGELFFALPGEHTDGHRFAADALARGAAAAVVSRQPDPPAAGARIRVPDPLEALHALTRSVRRRLPEKLVAITGSAGKTTTKEMLAALLARRFRVARSPGNLNNLLGFPLSLLAVPEGTEWMVAEMGMSEAGELGRISRLGRPDVAVLLNVRAVHLEFFDSLAAIADAKAELLEGLAPGGLVVANADDPQVARIARQHGGKTVWFGVASGAAVRAEELEPRGAETRFRLRAGGDSVAVRLPLYGPHNVENFLAAAATAWALGVGLEEIAAAAAGLEPAERRGVVHPLAGGGSLIDDSYNSNPEALARALEGARQLAGERHWAVLGSMLELGPEGERFHRRAGRRAAELGFSPVAAVGEEARPLAEEAAAAGAETTWLADADAAARWARGRLRPGDVVLVKGSRGIALEAVVEALRGEAG